MLQSAEERRREKHRLYMREWERARGAVPTKGTNFVCERCEGSFPKGNVRQKWCAGCKPAAVAEYKQRQRASAGATSVGSLMECRECKISVVKEFKRQFLCARCSALNAAEKLPHQVAGRQARAARFQRARRDVDPKWAIAARIGAGIRNSLKGGKSGRSWESLVGYTVDDLIKHLERQFLPGMSWANRALWHIDHRVPLSAFAYRTVDEPSFKQAWALTNLQPLWSVDNIQKSNSRGLLL